MDKLLAVVAFAFFCIFVGILAYKVPEIDLIIVVLIAVALVAYDFVTSTRNKDN